MKKLSFVEVRAALIRSGDLHPTEKQVFSPIQRQTAPPSVSRLNAVLARRQECSHAH